MHGRPIGSGTMASTFVGATKLPLSTNGGPPMAGVHARTVWNLCTGGIINACMAEDAPDVLLYREPRGKPTSE